MKKREGLRQLIHISAGIFFLLFFIMFGRIPLIILAFSLLVVGSLLIHFKLMGKYIPFVHDIGDRLEREDARLPGWGPALYLIGLLMIATVLQNYGEIAVGIILLGISDGASTLVGIHGTHRLPYNKKKTVEGTVVFFLSALIGYMFIKEKIILLALLAAFMESTNIPVDDNLLVPIVCTTYLFLF